MRRLGRHATTWPRRLYLSAKLPQLPERRSLDRPFVLVAGVGHCGTTWLATVMDWPEAGIEGFHEKKLELSPHNWLDALRYEHSNGVGGLYDLYFRFVADRLHEQAVVDANSWALARIPDVHRRFGLDGVILLVRNGIQTLHSKASANRGLGRGHWYYTTFLRWNWELAGRPGKEWRKRDKWDCDCFSWSLNYHLVEHLEGAVGDDAVVPARLEDLTTDLRRLRRLLERVNGNQDFPSDRLRKLQATDINRKVEGDRSPPSLWSRWSDKQRETFRRVCGRAMRHYSYELPA